MTKRDVGDLAESTFERWGVLGKFTANKAFKDRKGWDYFVQFPSQECDALTTPLDIRPPEFSCLLQIKGTDRRVNGLSVKLSNWQHLVKSPLPTFFLILAFGDQSDPKNGYLVHIGEPWIAQVLKRLRELPTDAKLNTYFHTLRWTEGDALPELSGDGLRQAIERHIGKDMRAYTLEKARWLETAGYDEGRYRMSVRIKADTNDELITRLTDFAIGLVEKIPIAGMELSESRFGIAVTERDEEFERAELSMQRQPDKLVQIRLRDVMGMKSIVFKDAAVYHPRSVFPFIDSDHIKVRIVTDYVELVMPFSNPKLEMSFRASPLQESFSVGRLAIYSRMVEVMDAGAEDGLVIEVLDPERGPVRLGRTVQGYALPMSIQHARQLRDAVWLFKHVDLDENAVTSPNELIGQQEKYRRFRAIVEKPDTITFKAVMNKNTHNETNMDTFCTIFFDSIVVGEWLIVLYAGLSGNAIMMTLGDNDDVKLSLANVSVLTHRFRIVHRDEADDENHTIAIQAVLCELEGRVD